jgi:hypothetical protein
MAPRIRKTGDQLLAERSKKQPQITAPDATDLPSALVLLNAIKATINEMNAEEPTTP